MLKLHKLRKYGYLLIFYFIFLNMEFKENGEKDIEFKIHKKPVYLKK